MSQAAIPSFPDFGKLVPGFDFLQNLAKQAAGGATQAVPQLPNLGNWIAPTLNLEELDKRVQELKAVQFWLDQNAAALKATIQALEVQKMTLATLKGMNFNMTEMANAFTLKTSENMASMKEGMERMSDKGKTFAGLEVPPSAFQAAKAEAKPEASGDKNAATDAQSGQAPAGANSMVDPMQWWGALTQQFQTIATEAMKEVANKTNLDATTSLAQEAVKTATDMAKGMAETATQTITGGARAAMDTALKSNWPTPGAAKTSKAAPKAEAPAKVSGSKTAAPKTAAAAPKSAAAKKAPARKAAPGAARKTTR
ncbi:MAG: hypothetical protein M3R45_07525 [Pseudomonadota bacterium]|nr:hypothetical protein [Pseudomonadota bacterium]